jgi:hypothetical protein
MILIDIFNTNVLPSKIASALGIGNIGLLFILTILEIANKGWIKSEAFNRAYAYIICTALLGGYNFYADIYHIAVPGYLHWITCLMALFSFVAIGSNAALDCNMWLILTLSIAMGKDLAMEPIQTLHLFILGLCLGIISMHELIYRIRKNKYVSDGLNKFYLSRIAEIQLKNREYVKSLERRTVDMSHVITTLRTRVYKAETKHLSQAFKHLHEFYIAEDSVSEAYYESRIAEITSQIHFFYSLRENAANKAVTAEEQQLLKEFDNLSEKERDDKLTVLKQTMTRLEYELMTLKARKKELTNRKEQNNQTNSTPEIPPRPTE